jgi:two-component system response regulator RegX3
MTVTGVTITGPLEIRVDETAVLAGGARVGLTVREFEVFMALAAHPDRVVQRPDIYREVWNAPMPYRDRAVDVFVRKVRQKLEYAAPGWTFIHTHFGIGYRFSPEPSAK